MEKKSRSIASRRKRKTHVKGRSVRRVEEAKGKSRKAAVVALGIGGLGTATAAAVGVGEVLFGGFVAYIAYRVIRYGISPTAAVMEGVELEHGEIPKDLAMVA